MAIRRMKIDYTVYSPNYEPGMGLCLDFRNLQKTKSRARGLGVGARVYRTSTRRTGRGRFSAIGGVITAIGFGMVLRSRDFRPVRRSRVDHHVDRQKSAIRKLRSLLHITVNTAQNFNLPQSRVCGKFTP